MTSIGCFHRSGVWLTHAFRLGGTTIPSLALVSSSYHTTSTLYLNRFLFDPSEVEYEHPAAVEEGTAATAGGLRTPPPTTTTGSPSPPVVVLPKDDYRTIHAAKILRLANGDTLRAGIVANAPTANTIATYSRNGSQTDRATIQWIPEGKIKKAAITKTGQPPGSLRITLHGIQKKKQDDDEKQEDDDQRLPVNLILALPRPLQLGRILPMIAQLGVQHVILTGSHKVPKDYFGSHLFRHPEKITKLLIEGLCQAGDDVRVPDVSIVKDVRSLFAPTTTTKKDGSTNTTSETSMLDELFPLATHARVIAHPQRSASEKKPVRMGDIHFPSTTTMKTTTVEKQQQKQLVVAIGPEGGWVEPEELDLFETFGFQQVTLGTRTLRSDCAVISLLSLANEVCLDSNSSHD